MRALRWLFSSPSSSSSPSVLLLLSMPSIPEGCRQNSSAHTGNEYTQSGGKSCKMCYNFLFLTFVLFFAAVCGVEVAAHIVHATTNLRWVECGAWDFLLLPLPLPLLHLCWQEMLKHICSFCLNKYCLLYCTINSIDKENILCGAVEERHLAVDICGFCWKFTESAA